MQPAGQDTTRSWKAFPQVATDDLDTAEDDDPY